MTSLEFTYSQLLALLNQRIENADEFTSLVTDLTDATHGGAKSRIVRENTNKKNQTSSILGLFSHLLHHLKQARKALRATNQRQPICIVGIDPKRLNLASGNVLNQVAAHLSSKVDKLAAWTQPIPDTPTLFFDPKTTIRYRSISDLTNLPVLSPMAVMFLAFMRPMSLLKWPSTFMCGWRHIGSSYPSVLHRFVSLFFLSLFLIGANILLRRAGEQANMLCLTANSVFLETLRARVLAKPGGKVLEVQHGIASPYFDPYFLSYKEALANGNHGQLDIYPLLAPPFCLPALQGPRFILSDQPSNSGIFKALVGVLSDSGQRPLRPLTNIDIPALTDAVVASTATVCNDGTPILAIFGGTDLTSDFWTCDSFSAEMTIAQSLCDLLRHRGPVQPVYLPHPTNQKLTKISLPDGTPMPIFEHSQLIFFCADYAFSLWSSTIFEASAMGAHVFSPSGPHRGILHEDMLRLIVTPKVLSKEGLNDCMSDFAARPATESANHKAKISRRIAHFLNGFV
jgi:hypothetical protein